MAVEFNIVERSMKWDSEHGVDDRVDVLDSEQCVPEAKGGPASRPLSAAPVFVASAATKPDQDNPVLFSSSLLHNPACTSSSFSSSSSLTMDVESTAATTQSQEPEDRRPPYDHQQGSDQSAVENSPPLLPVKVENDDQPIPDLDLNDVDDGHEVKLEDEKLVELKAEGGSSTSTPTPPPIAATSGKSKSKSARTPPPPPQIVSHLPVATEEARRTFEEITENAYQYAKLGRSREGGESMTCDCQYEHGVDDPWTACGDGSDCINRLTQIECLPGDCRCKAHCLNQRFQKRQYADIEVVQTEMKGFGLRAHSALKRDAFIYEYVGDVVSQPSFVKRMREYAEEGIRHFYFMMLQKDEFIDATKRGGLGRFANHSCAPNCYVAKWFIGPHVRMGIFAKRNILAGEELTFNYNVDRYGHEAQPCYCGEPKCVGFIGGKTQTDIVTVDDLYLDALGITEEERAELKGNKKKKGKKLDDPDFAIDPTSIPAEQMNKVYKAIRDCQSIPLLAKLLTRLTITVGDPVSLRAFLRLRGMSLLTATLEDNIKDEKIAPLALQCLAIMPLLNNGKVEDSNVLVPVQCCADSDDERVKELAQKLLDAWSQLPVRKRIAKRVRTDDDDHYVRSFVYTPAAKEDLLEKKWKIEYEEPEKDFSSLLVPKPPKKKIAPPIPAAFDHTPRVVRPVIYKTITMKDFIADIKTAEEARLEREQEKKRMADLKAEKRKERKEKEKAKAAKKKALTPEQKEALKEKRLLKLISPVVVKNCTKYSKDMGPDLFKKHAKQLCEKIAASEKKSSSYKDDRLEALSEEKIAKIKKFSKDYFVKEVHRLKKGRNHTSASTSSEPVLSGTPDSTLNTGSTPDSDAVAGGMAEMNMDMAVDDIMGFGPDDNSDEDMNIDGDSDMDQDSDGDDGTRPSPDTPAGAASSSSSPSVVDIAALDPRKRPPADPLGS